MNFDLMLGPLSPQELDNVINFLKKESIEFEISKDEKAEKEALQSNPSNDIELLYRTKSFSGQVFFITIHKTDFQKIRNDLVKMGIAPEDVDDQTIETNHELGKSRLNRGRWVSWILLAFILAGVLVSLLSKS